MKNKLTATGIIVEYNPLHNGHCYHIKKTREITRCDVLIAVMSPNFVQRGEPAYLDKWVRTEAALESGVDLVLELPTIYTLQSADVFAFKAVEILNHVGIQSLVFGSESNVLPVKPQFDKGLLKQGHSFAHASNTSNHQSNDILGVYYVQACQTYGITPLTILRTNNYHDQSISTSIASASAIRKAHQEGISVSHTTPLDLNTLTNYQLKEYEPFIHYLLSVQPSKTLSQNSLVSEGIQNLFIKHRHLPLDVLIETCTSKRYTRSRVQRTLMNLLLNFTKDLEQPLEHVRVLGMNTKGKAYLRQLSDDEIPYTTQFKHYQFKELELRATEVYTLPKDETIKKRLLKQEVSELIIKT
ncbi:nucleotidyltransferase family protein [Erysipelothrix rhusiopathiae]|uniref:tRNA(Met) cytidine acetate ligase n=1 Tax=Erysipelothrix rhusiopathiae ATCC 19414 TaxID=525280 RepID=E7FU30_ERYRH|nr:nucleotidyltransferase family protein [Erysipelothrix rhusiopathiae]EFY09341.1 hypothetical protein HMPREF0357_10136 [Erysipelothrix rhusiopathiae ATCC 19414]MDE8257062.1 nucleotidyltransferase family protein [Erysipelothrix rhusiopathiae]MDV7679401.1 nucleotidyltransferase family protein [Erysipelothrix rhusiopathiae]STD01287.1 Protein of uncharacterised function (DUF795) [Erysipelothrix rhusiopathiae]VEH84160.1 Protein of uncharacterised function (DUF795) [Erysipelothrix rhusiopathiae]